MLAYVPFVFLFFDAPTKSISLASCSEDSVLLWDFLLNWMITKYNEIATKQGMNSIKKKLQTDCWWNHHVWCSCKLFPFQRAIEHCFEIADHFCARMTWYSFQCSHEKLDSWISKMNEIKIFYKKNSFVDLTYHLPFECNIELHLIILQWPNQHKSRSVFLAVIFGCEQQFQMPYVVCTNHLMYRSHFQLHKRFAVGHLFYHFESYKFRLAN